MKQTKNKAEEKELKTILNEFSYFLPTSENAFAIYTAHDTAIAVLM